MQQVIWNLLANAIKFTPPGGEVDVALAASAGFAEIRVADTGKGIAPGFLPFVFDRFTQADGSISRAHGGLGVGLAIARSLVELHGGTIRAESDGEGRGAAFTVRLPILDRSAAAPGKASAPPAGPVVAAESAELAGLRLLVVDDEPDTCEMVKLVLEQCGAEVHAAASASQALSAMDAWRPHILLSDIGMPGQDGYELIKQIRARPAEDGGDVPAIALTAFARIEDRVKALAAGYHMHVPKPVEPDELVSIVANLVGMLRDPG
jgi:CheY-like chemotaxis protein